MLSSATVNPAAVGATSASAKFAIIMYNMPSSGGALPAQNSPRGELSVALIPLLDSSSELRGGGQDFGDGCRIELTEAQQGSGL
jgi:hypothetical protein